MKSIFSLLWVLVLMLMLSVVAYGATPTVQVISMASSPYISTGFTLAVVSVTALAAVALSKSKGRN